MAQNVYDEFIDYVKELYDVDRTIELLHWDQETYMPSGSVESRANMISTMSGISHRMTTAKKLGGYLDKLRKESAWNELDKKQKANVREVARVYEKETKLPESLVKEIAKAKSKGTDAWIKARKNNEFETFSPYLSKLVDLKMQVAEHRGYDHHPYDALLDDYEPYYTTKEIGPVLSKLESDLVPIVTRVLDSDFKAPVDILKRGYPVQGQEAFNREVLTDLGFDWDTGRLDVTAHPFTMGMGSSDVRITTRYLEDFLSSSIFSCIHEAGHAFYEAGFLPENDRTPMGESVSLGIHESQSRLWENLVGRSMPFWKHYFPKLKKVFPSQLKDAKVEDFYAAINHVTPSLIRVEADELTYNLHILLRYNIEMSLFDGKITSDETPQVWNELMEKYLQLVPDTDSDGVLQDIHWCQGYFGYFPTYTLGNLYSAQWFNKIKQDIPDIYDKIGNGEFGALMGWLRTNIHQLGKLYSADDLALHVSGEKLNPEHFLRYLRDKFGPLYGVEL